jgi:hypothetical protein
MPTFKTPTYSKVTHPTTGAVEPCYTFLIENNGSNHTTTFMVESKEEISVASLEKCLGENTEWWREFLKGFLEASAKLFSKPYTAAQIQSITKHGIQGTAADHYPAQITVLPKMIQIRGGVFWVHWEYVAEPIRIDIPDLEPALPVLNLVEDGVQEVNGEDLENATEETLEIDPPTKFYDKRRVKEAKLKARLAAYKAQRQINQFYEKYGTELSDSETESESEEDVQL